MIKKALMRFFEDRVNPLRVVVCMLALVCADNSYLGVQRIRLLEKQHEAIEQLSGAVRKQDEALRRQNDVLQRQDDALKQSYAALKNTMATVTQLRGALDTCRQAKEPRENRNDQGGFSGSHAR